MMKATDPRQPSVTSVRVALPLNPFTLLLTWLLSFGRTSKR